MSKKLNRRDLIKKAAIGTSAVSLTGLNPLTSVFEPKALGQATPGAKEAIVIYYLRGGMTGSFSSAMSFLNKGFGGINDGNILTLGNNLAVHSLYSRLPRYALDHMATIGVLHGRSGHTGAARANMMADDNFSAAHILAQGMGGAGTSKLIVAGSENPTRVEGVQSYMGVSDQRILDMQDAIDALTGGNQSIYTPDRALSAAGLETAVALSQRDMGGHPNSLGSLTNGYPVTIQTLKKPPQPFNQNELMNAYNLNTTAIAENDVAAQLALAEIMIRQDANIILASNRGPWDNHNNPTMANPIARMNSEVMPQIARFLRRVYGDPTNNVAPVAGFENYNVTFLLMGDFLRSGPGSGHSTGGAYTLFSKRIQNGSTAAVDEMGRISNLATPSTHAMWAFLGELVGASPQSMQAIISRSEGGQMSDKDFHKPLLRT